MAITAAQLDVRFTSSGAGQVKGELRDLKSATDAANSGFQKFQNAILGIGTAMLPVIGTGINFAANMEQQMANVNASLGGIDTSVLKELEEGFIDIGSASQFSAVEVAAVGDELAKAGFDPSLIVKMTEAVVDLSQATGTDLMTSVSGITAVMNLWKEEIVGTELALTDATEAADIYTAAANASSASVADIIAGVRNFGPTAAGLRISFNETAGAIAFFTNNGLKAADSGVSLTRMIEDLMNPTAEAQALMDEFNITLFDMQGNFVGLPSLFDQLNAAFGDMDPKSRQAALSVLFNAEALDVATIAAANGGDPLREIIKLTEQQGLASEQSALRMNTLKAQWGELVESAISLTGQLVSGLMPGLRGAVDVANLAVNAFSRLPQPILTAIGAVGALAAAFATLKGAAAGMALLGKLTGMTLPGTALLAGLATPLLALAAAAGVLYIAFRTNFLGIGDIVRNTSRRFVDGFTDMWDSLETVIDGTKTVAYQFRGMSFTYTTAAGDVIAMTNILSRVLFSLGAGFRAIGWDVLADGMDAAAVATETLITAFQDYRDRGIGPVAAGLMALGDLFPGIDAAFNSLADVTTNLGDAFQAAARGDWSQVFEDLGMAAFAAWNVVREVVDGIGGMVVNLWDWTLNVAAPAVTGWIIEAAGDVWSAISTAAGWAWDGLVTLGAWTLETAAPAVTGWIQTAAANAWDAIKSAAGWAGITIARLGDWALHVGTPVITGWLQASAGNIWEALKSAAGWSVGAIQRFGDWTLHVGTPAITGWLSDAAGIATTIKDKIVAGISGLTITGEDLAGIGTSVATALQSAITTGLSGLVDMGADFYNWLSTTIDGIEWNALGFTIGEGLGTAIRWAMSTLIVGGVLQGELFNWIGTALLNVDWMGLAQAVGSALLSMLQAAVEFSQGFAAGLFKGLFDPLKDELESTLTWIKDQFNEVINFSNEHLGTNFTPFDTPTQRAREFRQALEEVNTALKSGLWGVNPPEVMGKPVTEPPLPPGAYPDDITRPSGDGGPLGRMIVQQLDAARTAMDAYRASVDATATSTKGYAVEGDRLQRLIDSIANQQQVGATNAYDYSGALDELRENAVGAGVGVTLFGENALRATTQVQTLGTAAVGFAAAITAIPPATISIEADTAPALDGVTAVGAALGAIDGSASTVQVLGDNAGALAAVDGAAGALGSINGQIAQTFVNGDPSGAIGAIGTAAGALAGFDGTTGTAYLNAVDNVSGAVSSALAAVRSMDGATATAYLNVVTTGGAGLGGRIPGFASGGYVDSPYQIVGEHGPELVSLPYGSYVHTASETRAMLADENYGYGGGRGARVTTSGSATYQGDTIEVHIHGNVYGIDELADAMEGALSRRRRAFGVAA